MSGSQTVAPMAAEGPDRSIRDQEDAFRFSAERYAQVLLPVGRSDDVSRRAAGESQSANDGGDAQQPPFQRSDWPLV
jgi:hypothetical protein